MGSSDRDAVVLDALVLGAGFGGLHALYRLREQGYSVIALEAAPDVGGAWYWNRYPGARCDVESLVYCFTFSPEVDAEWRWSERYSGQAEIQRYLGFVADRLDLRRDIMFETRLVAARFDEDAGCWRFETENGEKFAARHFVSAAGPITSPVKPDIEGIDNFAGEAIHTARWPQEEPNFSGKRVGVIGTGSSGTQLIPIVAQQCEQLTVFLRTPNFYSPARNRPLTDEDYAWWEENRELTRTRLQRCERWGGGDITLDSETNDAMFQHASDFSAQRRREIYETRYACGGGVVAWAFADAMVNEDTNEEAADFLRSKIAESVNDPQLVETLTPRGFPYGTKRVTVGTDYYETYNRDNVDLVDVKATPIERFVAEGAIVDGSLVPLDVLIMASGFDALTGALTTIDIRGRDGISLRDAWQDGVHTHLGVGIEGFPNLYMIGGPQSPSVLTNVVMTNEMQVDWIADLIAHADRNGHATCEPTAKAQEEWARTVNAVIADTLWERSESWYVGANVPGKPRAILAFAGGFAPYKQLCDEEAAAGYPGFRFG